MYNISNLGGDPRRPIFSWRLGCSYSYHIPNRQTAKQIIKTVSYEEANARMGFVPPDLVARISRIYDFY
jgi:hypothetical protein